MDQLTDSKQKKLSMQQIIEFAAAKTASEHTKEQVYGSILKELTMPGSLVMQIGNSVFLAHRSQKDPTIAMMRALNADTAQNYLENCEQFAEKAYKEYRIDTIVSEYTDPTLNHIFAYIGRNRPENMGYKIDRMADGKTFRAVAKLGKPYGHIEQNKVKGDV
jgi:hypothetical protein